MDKIKEYLKKIKKFSLKKYVISKLLVKHKFKLTDLVVLNDGTKRNDYMEVQGLLYNSDYEPMLGVFSEEHNSVFVVREIEYTKYTAKVDDLMGESNG